MGNIERVTTHLAPDVAGGKASHLSWLIAHGERVPETWVIRPGAGTDGTAALKDGIRYAVRSSANVEDSMVVSYAGQFASELDVAAADIAEAVERVRRSVDSDRVAVYREHVGANRPIEISVIVQPMVEPIASGVAFSRNPMTGLNEVVVESIAGRGDRLVAEGETPDRWIRRWGSWTEKPNNGPVPEAVAVEIAATTVRLASEFGTPVDLEWVWDGNEVWWVQLRPITGLDEISIYSNRISREVLPGMIKPLVWSINVPMVNQAWVDLFTEAIGPNDIRAEDLARSFCSVLTDTGLNGLCIHRQRPQAGALLRIVECLDMIDAGRRTEHLAG